MAASPILRSICSRCTLIRVRNVRKAASDVLLLRFKMIKPRRAAVIRVQRHEPVVHRLYDGRSAHMATLSEAMDAASSMPSNQCDTRYNSELALSRMRTHHHIEAVVPKEIEVIIASAVERREQMLLTLWPRGVRRRELVQCVLERRHSEYILCPVAIHAPSCSCTSRRMDVKQEQ